MVIVTAKYRAFISDNYQGGSGKPYEDQVLFSASEGHTVAMILAMAAQHIGKKTEKVARLTMCNNDESYQLISIEITE